MFAHNDGLLGILPSLTASQVVKAGLQALDAGRVVTVVGTFNRFLPLMGRVLPRGAVRWLMGASAKPPAPREAKAGHAAARFFRPPVLALAV